MVTPDKKEGKKKDYMAQFNNIDVVSGSGQNSSSPDRRRHEFHYHFTSPVQDTLTRIVSVGVMVRGHVSSGRGNNMFSFRPYAIKKTFEVLTKMSEPFIGEVTDDDERIYWDILSSMNVVGPRKLKPGDHSNETVKTDKQRTYDDLVLCGVLPISVKNHFSSDEVKSALLKVVHVFERIFGHEDFHEHYKFGAYIDAAYSEYTVEWAIKTIQDANRRNNEQFDIDKIIDAEKDNLRAVFLLKEDKMFQIRNFHKYESVISYDVALDCLLTDKTCNLLIPKLIGRNIQNHLNVIMMYPTERSHGWLDDSPNVN